MFRNVDLLVGARPKDGVIKVVRFQPLRNTNLNKIYSGPTAGQGHPFNPCVAKKY